MASIGGVSGSNLNSIYGSKNVISGLASGMDTESMIENAVSGIKNRISGLNQKRTKWDWKQAGYQGITDKLVKFSQKYTSYNSATNLLSASFFNKAIITTTGGANKDKVSAAGKSSSEVYINAVKQLATAGRGTATGGVLGGRDSSTVQAGDFIDLKEEMTLSNVAGNMTLKYGTNEISLDFGDDEIYKTAEELRNGIIDKLKDVDITFSDGTTVKANERVDVKLDAGTGKISFTDKSNGGNTIEISGASGKLKETLGLGDLTSKPSGFTVDIDAFPLHDVQGTQGDFLSGKEMSFTLNGVTKKIKMPTYKVGTGAGEFDTPHEYIKNVQKQLDAAFGTDKIKVENASGDPEKLQFKFTIENGSNLRVSGDAAKLMELDGKTSYLNMTEKLGDFADVFKDLGIGDKMEAVGNPENFKKVPDKEGFYYDNDNNIVKKNTDDKYYRVDDEDNFAMGYELNINDKVIGVFTKDTSLDTIIAKINTNAEAGVNVSYSKTTGQFTFTAKETGEANGVKLNEGLARNLFGGLAAKDANGANVPVDQDVGVRGQDAILSTTINGNEYAMVRSTNTFDVDGMSITLNETFNGVDENGKDIIDDTGKILDQSKIKDKVSFGSKSDADKIVKTIKEMVDDYNAMLKEVKGLYGTPPAQKTNGAKYEPLTDEQRSSMSETEIKGYEETAKLGILYADSDLSMLYDKLRTALVPAGADGKALRTMGIDSTYSATDGISITLDEERLRTALSNNPDGVRDAFTKAKDGGAGTDGVMTNVKTVIDRYARTTGATKGILIERAGSNHAPTSTLKNTIKSSKDNIDKEIQRWEGKLSDSIDRYTRQFTQLEQLIAQMNAQSSSLMGLMGGNG